MHRLLAGLMLLSLVVAASAQPPDNGERSFKFERKGGGFGGRMMMMGSPDEMFDRFAKGKDVIRRDDLDPMMQMGFDMMARRLNITNGQITREQARQFGEQIQSRMRDGGMGGEMNDRFTEESFRRRDRNGDGLLDGNEMSDALKAEREKWDANKDGFVDLNEYKGYVSARFGDRGDRSNGAAEGTSPAPQTTVAPTHPVDVDPEARRPVVFRYGFLPKELPEWFVPSDSDRDGQVSLSEWVKAGKQIDKFREMDANDDDFVVAEEVLRFQNGGKIPNYNLASSYNSENRQPAYRFNPEGERRGPGGRGPGGGNWNGGGNNWMNGSGGNNADRINMMRSFFGGERGGFGPPRGGNGGPGRTDGNDKNGERRMEKGGKRGEKGGGRDRPSNGGDKGNGGRSE